MPVPVCSRVRVCVRACVRACVCGVRVRVPMRVRVPVPVCTLVRVFVHSDLHYIDLFTTCVIFLFQIQFPYERIPELCLQAHKSRVRILGSVNIYICHWKLYVLIYACSPQRLLTVIYVVL